MYQTDQASASTTLPTPAAAGTQGFFTNGNPATGVAATILDADFMNMLMMELVNVVSAAGLTPSKTTYNQVLAAIRRIGQNTLILADTGATNAYSAANSTPLVAGTWVDGVVQAVKIAHTNTGASTYAPDGLTAIPIYGLGLQPLQGGELMVNGTAILLHSTIAGVNGGNPICVLMECAGGTQQVPTLYATGKINGVNSANLLFNGSGEFGNVGWQGYNFTSVTSANNETYWSNAVALTGATIADASNQFPLSAGIAASVGCEINTTGMSGGTAQIALVAYNSSGASLGVFAQSQTVAGGSGWTAVIATGTTPTGCVKVTVNRYTNGSPVGAVGSVSFRRIKAEQGNPSLYSQEASIAAIPMPVVGSVRNFVMSVATASASATPTADEIIVETALGGFGYKLANFSKTINLGTTGAGGMDTGSAPTSGYVALYAIYNPSTQTAALLATNAASKVNNVYGGSNMPSGYTASALVSVWPTNGSGQFSPAGQRDRRVSFSPVSILGSSTVQASYTSLLISGAAPPNAVSAALTIQVVSNTVGSAQSLFLAGDANGSGAQVSGGACSVANNGIPANGQVSIFTAQTLYWKSTNIGGGTPTYSANLAAYDF